MLTGSLLISDDELKVCSYLLLPLDEPPPPELLEPPPPDEDDELPPPELRDAPPPLPPLDTDVPEELRGAGLDTDEGRLVPDDAGRLTVEGVLLVAGGAVRTVEPPVDRLSGRLYVALLGGLVYVEPEELPAGATVLAGAVPVPLLYVARSPDAGLE
jgi:hypothetical protein